MKIKVVHLINNLNTGGAETLISDYALKINKNKFEIIIVAVGYKNNSIIEEKLKNEGIKVIHLAENAIYSDSDSMLKKFLNKVHRRIVFKKIIKKEKPNIIHTHLRVNDFIIPLSIQKKGIKLFYTIHSDIDALFGKGKLRNRFTTHMCIKYKNMIPIALHPDMQEEVNTLFKINNTILLPNGIDLERFRNVNIDRDKKLAELNINKNAFIVGHIGRFVKTKNHEFLIKVFSNVIKRCPNAHLILVGHGELESDIREQVEQLGIKKSVSFLGVRNDIPELLSIMDVFVFPSLHEGFGNVLIEAQAVGVKCIVSDTVPDYAFITDLVTPISLDSPIDKWTENIISIKPEMKVGGDLQRHDINNITKELEKIYIESLNE